MPNAALKKKVSELPDKPGVYLMKDARGVVIYIGKANSLRDRVGSYFRQASGDTRAKLSTMVPQIADVEYLEAESEVDALLMEARLIKDVQPKYNENLRDSKLYPYLEITRSEEFPGVYVTRQRDNPRNKFYGPFTEARGLRQAVQLLQRAFRFRTCTLDIRADDAKRRFNRPCLLYYIERCTGPCADLVSREDYLAQIGHFQRFIEGKRQRVLRALDEEMRRASEALEYEKAARLRDQVRALESLAKRGETDFFPEATAPPTVNPREGIEELQELLKLPRLPRTIDGVDVSNLSGEDAVGSVVTFVDGRPFKSGYRRFHIRTVAGIDDYAMIGEVVERRFRRLKEEETPFPDVLLIDGGKGHLHAALQALKAVHARPLCVLSIAKREEIVYHGEPPIEHPQGGLSMVERPPAELRLSSRSPALRVLQYVRDEAHRFSVHYHHILRGKKLQAQI
jgi:excinuclease ABC subunit C